MTYFDPEYFRTKLFVMLTLYVVACLLVASFVILPQKTSTTSTKIRLVADVERVKVYDVYDRKDHYFLAVRDGQDSITR